MQKNTQGGAVNNDVGSLRVFFLFICLIWPSVGILSWHYVSKHFSEIAPLVFFVVSLLEKLARFIGGPPEFPF